jgi:hypothetical protein
MNDIEKKQYPASTEHLNKQSGLAFYLRCLLPGVADPLQITSDETWRAQRNPGGAVEHARIQRRRLGRRTVAARGCTPVDEGPGLIPDLAKGFRQHPRRTRPATQPGVSMVANSGKIRAALLAADPLQVALDRPNREVVVPGPCRRCDDHAGAGIDERHNAR